MDEAMMFKLLKSLNDEIKDQTMMWASALHIYDGVNEKKES